MRGSYRNSQQSASKINLIFVLYKFSRISGEHDIVIMASLLGLCDNKIHIIG